ncbi:MAG: carboxyl transferase domain-containing protein [Pseudomonadota bacterium]
MDNLLNNRLLIANRGDVAARIAAAAAVLGVESVAPYAEDDADSAKRIGASQLIPLNASGPKAYLDADRLLSIAAETGCDAVAVGYGFLSENASFADAVEQAGLAFVGPRAETIRRLGDKVAARAFAAELGVPLAPGTALDVSVEKIRAFMAEQDGPIMLKAAGAGGGRGMRAVYDPADLEDAYAAAQREAFAVGAPGLYAERLLQGARHVEVQIVGDGSGRVVTLGERDCTLQRRHQKLLEIAPAPNLDEAIRAELLDAAERMGAAAHYRGLGTVEFMVDAEGRCAFIEVNPRLQVEHTVTEEIYGLDLVATQLRLARGESLGEIGLDPPPAPRGRALQLRVCAEKFSADGGVAPSSGRFTQFAPPMGPGVRVDTLTRAGDAPSPLYDPLIAKLIVRQGDRGEGGDDFAALLGRARAALAGFEITGADTNVGVLAALLEHPAVTRYGPTTEMIEQEAAAIAARAEAYVGSRSSAPAGAREDDGGAADAAASPPALPPALPPGAEALRAPLAAMVQEIAVAPGDGVSIGETVAVLEALKMEHPVRSPVSGRVRAVVARPGQALGEGAALIILDEITARGDGEALEAPPDPAEIRPDLARALARNALVFDAARPEAMEKRRRRGRWSARANLNALCDPGSFKEYGALAVPAGGRDRPMETRLAQGAGDGIVTGFADVNAAWVGPDRAPCAVAAVDYTVMAGTQGFMHHRKMDRWLQIVAQRAAGRAAGEREPLVIFPEGGGGRPNDFGAMELVVAGLNVDTFHEFTALRGKTPLISVVSGWCFAGNALFPGASDIVIATEGASIGMGGPAMIEAGGLGACTAAEVGPARTLYAAGGVDLLAAEEGEAVRMARRAASFFQGPIPDWTCADQRLLRHAVPENRRRAYDMRVLATLLADADGLLELGAGHAPGLITALARVAGRPYGLIANNPMHLGGALDPDACDKGARFLRLCEAHRLPLISLCDTPGYMVGPDIEAQGQARRGVSMMVAGAALTVPIFAIVTRKAYGLGAQAMVGGSFTVPRFTIAWPTGELGAMGLEGAVRLAHGKRLAAIDDPEAREAAFNAEVDHLYAQGEALNAAAMLELDAVIDPKETRDWIIRAARAG